MVSQTSICQVIHQGACIITKNLKSPECFSVWWCVAALIIGLHPCVCLSNTLKIRWVYAQVSWAGSALSRRHKLTWPQKCFAVILVNFYLGGACGEKTLGIYCKCVCCLAKSPWCLRTFQQGTERPVAPDPEARLKITIIIIIIIIIVETVIITETNLQMCVNDVF